MKQALLAELTQQAIKMSDEALSALNDIADYIELGNMISKNLSEKDIAQLVIELYNKSLKNFLK